MTIAQYGGGLRTVQVCLAIRKRGENLPVSLDLPLLDLFGGHGDWGEVLVTGSLGGRWRDPLVRLPLRSSLFTLPRR